MGTAILPPPCFRLRRRAGHEYVHGGSKLPGMWLRRKLDARLLEVTQPAEATPDAGSDS